MSRDLDWSVPLALTFAECDTCRAIPGTPMLCMGCRRNRAVIEALTHDIKPKRYRLAQAKAAAILWPGR